MHKILLSGVRGHNKNPGEVRKEQNWIGTLGCSIEKATFVPPNPMQLSNYLENWERYASGNDIDVLIQTGILHAQFELLHPFKDGNGRLGRIIIPLFLFQKQALSRPMFYLSAYLEANRDEYYAKLQNISKFNDWNGWLEFFLTATTKQADANSVKIKKIITLYEEMKTRIYEVTKSKFVIQVLDVLFSRPIFSTKDFIIAIKEISKPTAMLLLKQLKKADILLEIQAGSGRRAAILCFPSLLNITEDKKII